MRALGRVALAGIFVLTLTVALFLIRSGVSAAPDYQRVSSTQGLEEKIIEISNGATGSQIALTLYEAGIVKSAQAFFRVAVSDPRSQQIAPGLHRITMKISAQQALDQLLDPERIPNLVKVFEGERKSEIVESLQKFGFTATEIRNAFPALKLPDGFKDSEGLLFPAQYSFVDGISATQALQLMIDRFKRDSVGSQLLQGSNSYSALQLLTIASIIQAEGDTSNFEKVSRVIYNRLKIGMPLQMDSTVHFVMNVRGDIFLSRDSTKLKSAYNTYRNYGLPPGPIGSPGTQAMKAALNPAVGDWLYFITVAPGDTRFTSDFDQFNTWKVLYTKNRKAGAFN
jgi:UPF0755 protein